ncbi:MAG TPA: hypothetical protein VF665_08815 [Longimicrobium sp.]|jgi:hypothetical protein|uniref:hypothetical protein n=1 Tax=Longimicrobium sp. TaxID=2029185 RepID=UPI002ED8F9B8
MILAPRMAHTAFPVFIVIWLALGPLSWLYIRARPTAAEKRRAHRMVTVAAAVIFGGFVLFMLPEAAFLMVPALSLITWLNLRNTLFCDQCGKMVTQHPFQRVGFCPRCGAPLSP